MFENCMTLLWSTFLFSSLLFLSSPFFVWLELQSPFCHVWHRSFDLSSLGPTPCWPKSSSGVACRFILLNCILIVRNRSGLQFSESLSFVLYFLFTRFVGIHNTNMFIDHVSDFAVLEEIGRSWGRSALPSTSFSWKLTVVKIFFKAFAILASNISKLEYPST